MFSAVADPRARPRSIRSLAVRSAAVLVAGFALASQPLSAQLTAVRFGKLWDGTGRVVQDAVVVVQGETVQSVGSGDAAVPAGARVIDLRRYTGIPGLIDVHTHITYFRPRPVGGPEQQPQRTAAQTFQGMVENGRRSLELGVTSVRDLGASNYTDLAIRDSINRGRVVGPRIFAAGYGLSKQNGTPPADSARAAGAARGRIFGVQDIPIAVKAQKDAGADWIKMYGSTGSYQNVTGRQTFTDEEMKAASDAAHALGMPIAIHSYGPEGARGAMRAGAESVEHPAGLDDATIREWARTGVMYVPTIDHNRFYAENSMGLGYTPAQKVALDSFRVLNMDTAARMHRAGVKFAMGSDAVYWMFGENTQELSWFVQIGMTPEEALRTATTNAAQLLRMPEKLGRVAPGSFADIVAIDGDPLADIGHVITGVRWVMKGGQVVVDKRVP